MSASFEGGLLSTAVYDGGLATLAVVMLGILVRPRASGSDHEAGLDGVPLLAGTVYCLVDERRLVQQISPNADAVLGAACSRAAELDLSLRELLQPDDADQLENWLAGAWLEDGSQAPTRLAARAPDAGTRWLEVRAPGMLSVGKDECMLIEVVDVTARAEQENRDATLTAAFEASADAVYITTRDGTIEYANGAFEQLTGYSLAKAVGRPASMLASGRHRADFFARMWSTLEAGEPYTGEVVNRRPDGSLYTIDLVITPLSLPGEQRFLAVARDVTARKQLEREVEDLAYYDPLTGLANHRLLRERSSQILALARRHGSMAALVHIDLDRLATVNAQHGRAVGDEVLRTVAERLRQGLRESDTLARIGSDEFLVLLSEVQDEEAVARVVRRLHEAITQPFRMQHTTVTLGVRAGIALYPQDAGTFDELIECTDTALHRANQTATPFEFYEHTQSAASHDRMSLEEDMSWAWENDQFILHYQPIIGVDGRVVGAEALARGGEVIGLEALARWPHLERGMLSPSQFIPLAERTGRILSLDRWAIATAAKQAATWLESGWDGWISVNLSTRTLHDPDLPDYMARTLKAHGLGAGHIAIEITEGTAMRDPLLTARVLEALRDSGVLIAVDDFGVGHSSLAYLKLFPVDLLKLDASFVRDIGTGGREEQLVEIMISLAHRIGAKVVAEGVEEEEQMTWLRAAGCDYVQGFLLGRPAAPDALPPPQTRAAGATE